MCISRGLAAQAWSSMRCRGLASLPIVDCRRIGLFLNDTESNAAGYETWRRLRASKLLDWTGFVGRRGDGDGRACVNMWGADGALGRGSDAAQNRFRCRAFVGQCSASSRQTVTAAATTATEAAFSAVH